MRGMGRTETGIRGHLLLLYWPARWARGWKANFYAFACERNTGRSRHAAMTKGRPMDWNLKLTPTGVEDLGYSPVPSPLEIVDEVFYRTAKGIPADDIAAPQVVAQARALVRRMPKEKGSPRHGRAHAALSEPRLVMPPSSALASTATGSALAMSAGARRAVPGVDEAAYPLSRSSGSEVS